jgi:integrase
VVVYKHLLPGLGHIKLQKLTGQQVQSFYADKLKKGMSPSRLKLVHSILHKALGHARQVKLVGFNVADGLSLPKYEKRKPQVLDPEQVRLLLEGAKERNLYVLLAVAVTTAMREGEILSLRWSDIDMDKKLLKVARTVNYLPGYHFVEGEAKTETSQRNILLPHFLVELLKQHRASQLETRSKVGEKWIDQNLVFPNRRGKFMRANTLRNQLYKLLADVGLPHMRFHVLRHSAATILLSMGVPAHVVQEILGHSDVAITLGIYGGVLPSMREDVVDKMEGLFGSPL